MEKKIITTLVIVSIVAGYWFAYRTGYKTASYDYDTMLYDYGVMTPSWSILPARLNVIIE